MEGGAKGDREGGGRGRIKKLGVAGKPSRRASRKVVWGGEIKR